MKDFVKWMQNLPLVGKIILALPALDIFWVVYRVFKSFSKNHTLFGVIGIILIIVGLPWLWLVDIITLLLVGKVIWFD